jgi:ribose transport system ATP-binding protein
MSRVVLEMQGISKRFGATQALSDVRLTVRSHEIHCIVGENGAGKSTLMKVLSGVYQPDAGSMVMEGKPVTISGPSAARALGINLIYQELSVATHMTVAQNVFLGSEPRGRFGTVDTARMNRDTAEVLRNLGAPFRATTLARRLSIAEQQQVEIARALVHRGRILIMDEPTAALSDRETASLFRIIQQLRDEGMAVIYISHRMAEIMRLSDRVTVLRDGGYVGELEKGSIDPARMVQMMVGRPLKDFYQHRKGTAPGKVVLEVRGLAGGKVKPSSLQVRAGEVVGLAGLVGAGRTELARLVFGADRKTAGRVLLDGQEVEIAAPAEAIRLGIGYLPEDRKSQGLFLKLSALTNATMNVVAEHSRGGVVRRRVLGEITRRAIQQLSIRVEGPESVVGRLSGGNQQKVLLARWLAINPRVLLLDEPTRGVDVGAKNEIYRIIGELAAKGVAVLVISSELPEVVGICDRVLVMREGEITGELAGNDITQERIMTLATHAGAAA